MLLKKTMVLVALRDKLNPNIANIGFVDQSGSLSKEKPYLFDSEISNEEIDSILLICKEKNENMEFEFQKMEFDIEVPDPEPIIQIVEVPVVEKKRHN